MNGAVGGEGNIKDNIERSEVLVNDNNENAQRGFRLWSISPQVMDARELRVVWD